VHHTFVLVSCNPGYVFSLGFRPDPPTLFQGERAAAYVREAGRDVSSEVVFDIIAEDNQFSPDFVRSKIARDLPGVPCPEAEVEMDRVLMRGTLQHVMENPRELAVKLVKDGLKFWYFFDSWATYMPVWATALPWILVGIVASLRRRREFMLIYLLTASAIVNGMIFLAAVRFRLPFEPFVLVFSVVGFAYLWDRFRARWLLCLALPALLILNLTLRTHQDEVRSLIRRAATSLGFDVIPWQAPGQTERPEQTDQSTRGDAAVERRDESSGR
jgi:hypothetical protein